MGGEAISSIVNMIPAHEQDRSGWYGNVHIYAPACIKTPAWATHERLTGVEASETVIADCCLCKMRADETVVEIFKGPKLHLPRPKDYKRFSDWKRDYTDAIWGNFFEPYVVISCGPGLGCNAKPKRRQSRHLREWR